MKTAGPIVLMLIFFAVASEAFAQLRPLQKESMTISGAVIDADSLYGVPFVTISVNQEPRGTISDQTGFFTLRAAALDTLNFSAVGYKKTQFIVPPDLLDRQYTLVEMLERDTIILREVTVYSFPTMEAFVEAFMNAKPRKTMVERAMESQKELDSLLTNLNRRQSFYHDQWRQSRLYNMTGIMPANNFLNPSRWADFISRWRQGKYDVQPMYPADLRPGINLIDEDQ